jgi:hypothetical protein
MKHTLPAMILAQPTGFYADRLRFRRAEYTCEPVVENAPQKNFLQFSQPLGEIREQLHRYFAFVSARSQNMRH